MMHIISSQSSVNVPFVNSMGMNVHRKRYGRIALMGFALLMIIVVSVMFTAFLGDADAHAAGTHSAEQRSVIVEKGDTLWSIANEHITNERNVREYIYEIKQMNGLKDASLRVGQKLLLP